MAKKQNSGGTSNTPAQNTLGTMQSDASINVLLDWLGFTFLQENLDAPTVLGIISSILDIPETMFTEGRRNYEGYAHSLTFENINIYYGGQAEQGIHVDFTGQGCRYTELKFLSLGIHKMNWYKFIALLREMPIKFTRIDVAIDDHIGFYTVPQLFKKCLSGEITMKFKSWSPDGYFSADGQAKTGMTLYFGSDVSRFQIVIYEKGLQLGLGTKWTRTELRFKHERAEEFIDIFLFEQRKEDEGKTIGIICAGFLAHYLTFREQGTDSNKARWQVSDFWKDFLQGIEPRKLTTALPDRSIQRMQSWIDKQVDKSLACMFFAYQDIHPDWIPNMIKSGAEKLKDKDLLIINEYRRLYNKEINLFKGNYIEEQGIKKPTDQNDQ